MNVLVIIIIIIIRLLGEITNLAKVAALNPVHAT